MNTIKDLEKTCIYQSIMLLEGIDNQPENVLRYKMERIGEYLIRASKE